MAVKWQCCASREAAVVNHILHLFSRSTKGMFLSTLEPCRLETPQTRNPQDWNPRQKPYRLEPYRPWNPTDHGNLHTRTPQMATLQTRSLHCQTLQTMEPYTPEPTLQNPTHRNPTDCIPLNPNPTDLNLTDWNPTDWNPTDAEIQVPLLRIYSYQRFSLFGLESPITALHCSSTAQKSAFPVHSTALFS